VISLELYFNLASLTLSEIENGLSARLALKKIFSSYRITNWKLRSKVHALIIETIRRLNYIDWSLLPQ
jgi:hypothetical protein